MAVRKWRTDSTHWQRVKPAVRIMRREPTPAEQTLWAQLRRFRRDGLTFRRQHPLGRFVVDFYCPSVRLVVEVDGGVHDGQEERDAERTQLLEAMGCSVLRFTNRQVLEDAAAVAQTIRGWIDSAGDGPR
jgi:very-short-patch-repair endonuclease